MLALVAVPVAVGAYFVFRGQAEGGVHVDVRLPDLSRRAKRGAALFVENCSTCHGVNAAGSDRGPPLIDRVYEPGHHGDGAFHRAVQQGVRSHHWSYGNMPPVSGLGGEQIRWIVMYVRELQRANGIP